MIVKITEIHPSYNEDFDDFSNSEKQVFFIDIDLIQEAINNNRFIPSTGKIFSLFEYDYIKHIIDSAVSGKTYILGGSKKFSFSDTPDWWDNVKAKGSHFDYEIEVDFT